MVRCKSCKSDGKKSEYSDPHETGLRSRKGGYPIISGFILPASTKCNLCGQKVRTSGWFEKDEYL